MSLKKNSRYYMANWEYVDCYGVIRTRGFRIVRRFKNRAYKTIAYFPLHQARLAKRILKGLE